MRIVVNEQISLSEVRLSDKAALRAHLNDKAIYDCTLRIPFPYTEKDADDWLTLVTKTTPPPSCPYWAIRNAHEALIGGCGLDGFQVGKCHRAEIGYWLAKSFWGRGIMTEVVQRVCQHAFAELGLVKIVAHVFEHNRASARVLEKCAFQEEGYLRKHYFKDGKFIDARLFALLKGE